jgi:hypothetical protein
MPKINYVQPSDNAFSAQLQTFKNNIGSYATTLSLSAAQVTGQEADADYFDYTLKCQSVMQNGAQQWTTWKDLTRDGGTPPPTGMPVAPVFPTAVPPVASGVEARFRALVKQIKASANYNEAIGDALGIEGAQHAAPDLTTVQPDIDATVSGGKVGVDWGWQGNSAFLDMCEIQVDRGDGKGFSVLAYDTTPGYVDTAPFPASPAKWTYKAIYRVNDAQVGQWSNPVSVAVQS